MFGAILYTPIKEVHCTIKLLVIDFLKRVMHMHGYSGCWPGKHVARLFDLDHGVRVSFKVTQEILCIVYTFSVLAVIFYLKCINRIYKSVEIKLGCAIISLQNFTGRSN